MALREFILLTIGGSVVKYLFKEVLPADWQDEIDKELVSFTVNQISGRDAPDQTAISIGERLDLIYQRSSSDEDEKAVALRLWPRLAATLWTVDG